MSVFFQNSSKDIPINVDKLCLQALLVTFAVGFIFVVTWCMRIFENQYYCTIRKMAKLKTRMKLVLSHEQPLCERILYYNLVRYRRSLIASYLKDLMNESQYNQDKCSTGLFKHFPKNSAKPYQRNIRSPSQFYESIRPKAFLQNYDLPKTIGSEVNDSEREIISKNKDQDQSLESKVKVSKRNDQMSSQLSKFYKSFEGQRRFSSNLEKKKSKIPKYNVALKSTKERHSEHVTVYTALINPHPTFRLKSLAKNLKQKTKIAFPSSKTSCTKQPPCMSLNVSPSLDGGDSPNNCKLEKTNFESTKDVENQVKSSDDGSVGSSVCESDCESDISNNQYTEEPVGKVNNCQAQNAPLTTIKEESAEDIRFLEDISTSE